MQPVHPAPCRGVSIRQFLQLCSEGGSLPQQGQVIKHHIHSSHIHSQLLLKGQHF